jgi:hypothetical protein
MFGKPEWQALPTICDRVGISSDLVNNLHVAQAMEVKFVHDEQGQAILAMPTGLLSDSELLDRIDPS